MCFWLSLTQEYIFFLLNFRESGRDGVEKERETLMRHTLVSGLLHTCPTGWDGSATQDVPLPGNRTQTLRSAGQRSALSCTRQGSLSWSGDRPTWEACRPTRQTLRVKGPMCKEPHWLVTARVQRVPSHPVVRGRVGGPGHGAGLSLRLGAALRSEWAEPALRAQPPAARSAFPSQDAGPWWTLRAPPGGRTEQGQHWSPRSSVPLSAACSPCAAGGAWSTPSAFSAASSQLQTFPVFLGRRRRWKRVCGGRINRRK